MTPRKILICGLPGSGKTTLARALRPLFPCAVVFDGDDVRGMDADWDFSEAGRNKQASRMRWLCERVTDSRCTAIAAFVCPTPFTRNSFDADYTIFCDRVFRINAALAREVEDMYSLSTLGNRKVAIESAPKSEVRPIFQVPKSEPNLKSSFIFSDERTSQTKPSTFEREEREVSPIE